MLRRLKILFSLPLALLFSIQLLVTSPALSGLTLCIDEESRVGSEAGKDECCAPTTHSGADAAFSVSGQECDCCIDVALCGALIHHQVASAAQTTGAFFTPALVLERLGDSLPVNSLAAATSLPVNTSLTAIRSVVLRV